AFTSGASNLVPGDTNRKPDAFVRDLQTGQTTRVSVSGSGTQANFGAAASGISADGRYVVFDAEAYNLAPSDTNDHRDVFVRDLRARRTSRISVSSRGKQALDRLGNGSSGPSITADGRYVAFASSSANLVAGDKNRRPDIFIRDRKLGKTVLVSVGSGGAQTDAESRDPMISPDGHDVAFTSFASHLGPGDSGSRAEIYVRRL